MGWTHETVYLTLNIKMLAAKYAKVAKENVNVSGYVIPAKAGIHCLYKDTGFPLSRE
jgi:hypothetical protein